MGTKFKVEGHEGLVDTAKEVQKLLGNGIKMKDILAGAVQGVVLVDESDIDQVAVDDAIISDTNLIFIGQDSQDLPLSDPVASQLTDEEFMSIVPDHIAAQATRDAADEAEVAEGLKANGTAVIPPVPVVGDIEYPEVGAFADKKAMKKYVKKLSDAQIFDWLDLEGVLFTPCDHESINRMRAVMAMTAKHFPTTAPVGTKSKSKYADMSDDQLIKLAADKKVVVKDAKGDARIRRMYTIMALKAAGHLA